MDELRWIRGSQVSAPRLEGLGKLRRVVIITGGGTGIGAASAELLASRSYNVAINYRRSHKEAEAVEKKCRALGVDTLLIQGDVSDDASCRAIAAATIARWGRLDVLVNNAGITAFTGIDNWDALDAEVFQKIYAVNSIAAFQMVRACVPHLKEHGGSIVNVSSAAGVVGRGSSVPYIMSKGALNTLTLYLARTLAPHIRVNAVCPGLVTTRWFRDGLGDEAFDSLKEKFERDAPLRRACEPEEVAEAVLWLIEGARATTGELLLLDSGRHLG